MTERASERAQPATAVPFRRLKLVARRRAHLQFSLSAMATLVILALAFGLRVFALTSLGFNSDEAVYSGQAAALARDPILSEIFPIFRAHPLLFQFILSIIFRLSVGDLAARLVSAAVGVATVFLVNRLGNLIYGRRAGLIAALFMALMPYHVIVTRQVLLDGPMTLFSTLTLYLMARYALTRHAGWLYAAGAAMGLTFLAKETGILMVGAIYAFLALSPEIKVRLRDLALSTLCMALVMAPFPLTVAIAGGGGSERTQQYLVWQLFRRPNHEWDFYLANVPESIGPLLIAVAVFGLWWLRRERSWREKLLLSWIFVPALFFQMWPTKGFQYLLPLAPAIASLAGRALGRRTAANPAAPIPTNLPRAGHASQWIARLPVRSMLIAIVTVSLLIPSWQSVNPSPSAKFLAGSGGVPGGREAGLWLLENAPDGATLMTIGPSMANILQFYGHRRALGLSVSPNPLHRNPAYQPIRNPDLEIRTGAIQYLVWDAYSARRSEFFSEKLLVYAQRYHGRVVHVETVELTSPTGQTTTQPVIVIYEVRP